MLFQCRKFCRLAMASSAINSVSLWTSRFPCQKTELRIDITLDCGQSFRWHETSPGVWTGVMKDLVWTLSQTDHELLYHVHQPKQETVSDSGNVCRKKSAVSRKGRVLKKAETIADAKENASLCSSEHTVDESASTYTNILRNYFQLDVSLENLCTQFSERDENFRHKASQLKGVRLLQQDPVETLFSFICSSNNNITRITSMIEKMCSHFGQKITEVCGVDYYTFPTVERLAGDDVEATLRELGFGYRAKFISNSAKTVLSRGGSQYLYNLRSVDYETAKAKLMELQGVGAKVADCICLMSLDKMAAVPVDTHVKQIAERDYALRTSNKSCTDAVYKSIGEYFQNLWGPYAGWAQCVLFAADLKKFKDVDDSSHDKGTNDAKIIKNNRKRKRTIT